MTQSLFGSAASQEATPQADAKDTKAQDSVNGSAKANNAAQLNISFDTNCSTSSPRKMLVDGASTTQSISSAAENTNVLDELATFWEE